MATKPKQPKALKADKKPPVVKSDSGGTCPTGYVSDGHGGCIRDPG